MNSNFLNIPDTNSRHDRGCHHRSRLSSVSVAVLLGFLAKKQWKSFDEYLVGKRDIGPWVTGLALTGSYISGWAFCGSTAVVYKVGFSGMWFAGIWTLVGIIPTVWLAATKTRDFASKLGAATITETIGRRFESKGLQTLIAASMLFFLFIYSVGQLKAAGAVWYAVTGLPPFWCLLISITIAWLFLVFGGYTGTQWFIAVKGGFLGFVGLLSAYGRSSTPVGSARYPIALMAQKPTYMALINPGLPQDRRNPALFQLWWAYWQRPSSSLPCPSAFPITSAGFWA